MRLSIRHIPMATGRSQISAAISKAIKEQHLTYAEVTAILADEMRAWAGYNIKDEREGEESNG